MKDEEMRARRGHGNVRRQREQHNKGTEVLGAVRAVVLKATPQDGGKEAGAEGANAMGQGLARSSWRVFSGGVPEPSCSEVVAGRGERGMAWLQAAGTRAGGGVASVGPEVGSRLPAPLCPATRAGVVVPKEWLGTWL